MHCSHSQVKTGECGAVVDKYTVSSGATAESRTNSVDVQPNYDVQFVRMASESLMTDGYFFDNKAVSGYFQLSFGGETTGAISAQASAADLRDAVESLSAINTVKVSRAYSTHQLPGVAEVEVGYSTLDCATANCGFTDLLAGEHISLGGVWYRVHDSYDGVSATALPLATSADASISDNYDGTAKFSGAVLRWARGFEWAVTFLSTTEETMSSLSSPAHGLAPLDAALSVRAQDCVNCLYITGLTAWTNTFLSVSAHNRHGYGVTTDTQGVPQEIPGAPENLLLASASGTELFLFFDPPASSAAVSGIDRYSIEWDTNEFFTHPTNVADARSCASTGHGLCNIAGAAIDVVPPYEFTIPTLTQFTTYYVRVAARNSLSVEAGLGEADSTNWSSTAVAFPEDQPPSAPLFVNGTTAGPTVVQIIITKPKSNGGIAITDYSIELSTGANFATVTTMEVPVANLDALYEGGSLVYDFTGLTQGFTYYVRVRAKNTKGYSVYTTGASTVSVAGKPAAPASVSIVTQALSEVAINSIDVAWTAPASDGGESVDEYVVEWWQRKNVPEQQLIRLFQADPNIYSMPNETAFSLKFSTTPDSYTETVQLVYNIDAYNLRSELMNMGYEADTYPIDDLDTSRATFPGAGYEWTVTFAGDDNQGDVPSISGKAQDQTIGEVTVIELVPGSRPGGISEQQIVSIMADQCDITLVEGFFRLSFNGTSQFTTWLTMDASVGDVQTALAQLPSLAAVSVTQADVLSDITCPSGLDTRQFTVTFDGDDGNQPALYADFYLNDPTVLGEVITITVYDGDNSLSNVGKLVSSARPGELPYGYNMRTVNSADGAFTIDGLVSGEEYFVSVRAKNAYGMGPRQTPATASLIPPKQIPLAPSNVEIKVDPGSSTTLLVGYDAPSSDGGSDITSYRIELDTNEDFGNPIAASMNCPTANKHTVFEIQTAGLANDPIASGYFDLTMSVNGISADTAAIPYDASAMMQDEVGVNIDTGVTVYGTNGTQYLNITGVADATDLLFIGNRIKLDASFDSRTVYTITDVVYGTRQGTLTAYVELDQVTLLTTSSFTDETVYRHLGGRGYVRTESRIACINNVVSNEYCPQSRVQTSGSLESKLQVLDLTPAGLIIERDTAIDATNGATWRVTFLDDSPKNPLDYTLALKSSSLVTQSGAAGSVTVSIKTDGFVYEACTGDKRVPTDKALQMGQLYYARVSAINEIGFGPATLAPTSQKPMVSPGGPTSVALTSVSKTELRVTFNPPVSDGGDLIISYRIEYSTSLLFTEATTLSTMLTYLEGGSPFAKTISGLTTGLDYYVRVSAVNSQGIGATAISTPDKLNPHEPPEGPSNVRLRTTSNSMLTVGFDLPVYDGGDAVTHFKIEWDTSATFQSATVPMPHKGSVEVDAATHRSYTLTLLTQGQGYYVRVYAKNNAGYGSPTLAVPTSSAPQLQVPGRPHTVSAAKGDIARTIVVSWQRPRVPFHGIPCTGTLADPFDCPAEIGDSQPSSVGGSDVTEYVISYNEKADFTGFDGGSVTTTVTNVVLNSLTSRRTYYIRVLARNAQGSGLFCGHTDTNCVLGTADTVVTAVAK